MARLREVPTALELLVKVMEYGDTTHPGKWHEFWNKENADQLLSKVFRHALKSQFEELDESGLPHWAHALCDLVFYLELKYGSETNSTVSPG